MKKSIYGALFIGLLLSFGLVAFQGKPTNTSYEYMQINVLESVVKGGVGRSRMIVTDTQGNSPEPINLDNYYSLTGMNFSNIQSNEKAIVVQLNLLGKEGWEVVGTTSGGNEVYFTKYTLRRPLR